jgi:hypothetical protein
MAISWVMQNLDIFEITNSTPLDRMENLCENDRAFFGRNGSVGSLRSRSRTKMVEKGAKSIGYCDLNPGNVFNAIRKPE